MESSYENSWKRRFAPLLPPILLRVYRQARYGDAYRQANLSVLDRLGVEATEVEFALPSRKLNDLLPGIDSVQVTAPATEIFRPRDMVVPLTELMTLAAICRYRQPREVFEFGTHTGSSTLVMAINVPDQTGITTLDFEQSEMIGSAFRNTEYSSRIHQIYGDSRTFDYTPFLGKVDFVYIDADHTYDGVKSDTEKAFKLLRPGGVIVWDDYRWADYHVECVGVTLFLNEFQTSRPVFNIAGTRFAIYVDPEPGNDRRV